MTVILPFDLSLPHAANAQSPQAEHVGVYMRENIKAGIAHGDIIAGTIVAQVAVSTSASELAQAVSSIAGTVQPLTTQHDAVPGLSAFKVGSTTDTFDAMLRLSAVSGITHVGPDVVYRAESIPSDPQFGDQWALQNTGQSPPGGTPGADINAPAAWDITTGTASTVVAVVDSGVQLDHPEFAGRIWFNPVEAPGGVCDFNGVDTDGNGLIDDCRGYDFVTSTTRDNDPSPCGSNLVAPDTLDCGVSDGLVSHGTHVAGIIGAAQNNSVGGFGTSGVAPGVTIMPVRALSEDGSGTTTDVLDAMNYAINMGAKVVNMSFGSDIYDASFDAVVASAASKDVVLVAAAGNAAENIQTGFACDSPVCNDDPSLVGANDVIGVAATTQLDRKASYSNYSNQGHVDVAAPGGDVSTGAILSTCYDQGLPGSFTCSTVKPADVGVEPNEYGSMSGTSQATPHVAGVAALVRSKFPALTAPQVANAVMFSGADITAANAGLNGCPASSAVGDCTTGLTGTIGKSRLSAYGAFLPHLVGVSPTVGTRGTSLSMTLTGINTTWSSASVVDVGEGVGVSGLSCSTTSACTVALNIPNSSPLGKRTVTVTSGAEVVSLANVFTVQDAILRIAGDNRVKTAIETSKIAYANAGSAKTVLVARSDAFPDSLAGTPLAGFTDGPILFTGSKSLDPETAAEIQRVLADDTDEAPDIYLLGGTSALSASVESALNALKPTWQVKRIGGNNRAKTSLLIAEELHALRGGPPRNVIIATQSNFPDALAAAVPATDATVDAQRSPILLTDGKKLSQPARDYLTVFGPSIQSTYVVGGSAAVSDSVFSDIDALVGTTIRLAGPDRYKTAKAIDDQFYANPLNVSFASGKNFPDALAGSYLSAKRSSPMLLINGAETPQPTIDYVKAHAVTILGGFMFGGTAVIPESVRALLEGII